MRPHSLDERHEFSATLRQVGAGAPTLCGDWTTRELVAHLVLRERSLVEAAGRLPVPRLRDRAERAIADLAARQPYERTVTEFEDGPPPYSPFALAPLREAVNLLEYVIHHEDVRRGDPGQDPVPRSMPLARQRAVWQRLRLAAPLTMRAVPVGVRLVWPANGEIATRRRGTPVVVTGDPVELALIAFGRQRAARVSYEGSDTDIARVSGARIRI
jgi:uncharacterized protein (TIGR03085 family)